MHTDVSSEGQEKPRPFLARFRRVTTSGAFIGEIDGLRFVAIGTVVLFHIVIGLAIKSPSLYAPPGGGNLLFAIARFGYHGVELFFIISGFILALPFASHHLRGTAPVRLGSYFLRRLTRLEPPYLLCLVLFFILLVLSGHRDARALLPHLAASMVYLHNLIYRAESLVNNVAWSLEIEIQFYILVPLIANLFRIRNTALRRTVIASLAGFSDCVQWLFIGPDHLLYLTIVRFFHFFLMGFLLADVYIVTWAGAPKRDARWDIVSLIGWPALFLLWNNPSWSAALTTAGKTPILENLFFPACALMLYMAAFRGALSHRVFTNGWIATIGGMCYTIYLLHNLIISLVFSATKNIAFAVPYAANVLVQALMVVPVVLCLSGLYFLLIEKPCMRKDWPSQLAQRVRLILGTAPVPKPAEEAVKAKKAEKEG